MHVICVPFQAVATTREASSEAVAAAVDVSSVTSPIKINYTCILGGTAVGLLLRRMEQEQALLNGGCRLVIAKSGRRGEGRTRDSIPGSVVL